MVQRTDAFIFVVVTFRLRAVEFLLDVVCLCKIVSIYVAINDLYHRSEYLYVKSLAQQRND